MTSLPTLLPVLLALVVLAVIKNAVHILRPYERGVVERLGKYSRTVNAGLAIVIPGLERVTKVDMREQAIDVVPQGAITRDNVVLTVDAVVYYEPTDPVRLLYNVGDFFIAVTKLAQTNLRNIVGDLTLDDALTSRDTINAQLVTVLDDATDKWGVKVVRVEVQRVDPPDDVTEAMHRQMKAERERRAQVLEATGDKEARVLTAEGLQQAEVLEAEGHAKALLMTAEAQKKAEVLRAEGEALAIEKVFRAIHDGDADERVLALKYLEALAKVADGQATKLVLPLEMSGIAGAASSFGEAFRFSDDDGPVPPAPTVPTLRPVD